MDVICEKRITVEITGKVSLFILSMEIKILQTAKINVNLVYARLQQNYNE